MENQIDEILKNYVLVCFIMVAIISSLFIAFSPDGLPQDPFLHDALPFSPDGLPQDPFLHDALPRDRDCIYVQMADKEFRTISEA